MHTLKTTLRFATFLTINVLMAAQGSVGQDITGQVNQRELAKMPLENVLIEEAGIAQLLARFSFAYNIPIGLEVARGGEEPTFYHIDFKKGTLSNLLTQFVA